MKRKPMMAGNWKMNNTISEGVVLAQQICNRFEKDWGEDVDVVLCTPFLDLKPTWTVIDFENLPISVGAQNCYWEEKGAFTGEISVGMLKEARVSHCIIGHSERRTLFGELNEDVNKKAKALLAQKMTPIICVGESLSVRDEGTHLEYVCAQVKAAFAGIDEIDAKNCVVAYEPIWAIGTGRTATPEQAQEVCAAIRGTLGVLYGQEIADGMRVLYGGSMNTGNVEGLLAMEDIDGGLIGGAALKAESFVELIKACL